MAVTLSNDSLADLPLEERCLTAEVTNAVPWPSKRENDTATVCLGDEPKIPLREGDVSLFYLYDCTVAESTPCTSEDTVELVVQADRTRVTLPGVGRVDDFDHRGEVVFLQPESVIVQVRDPEGRQSDGTWHTGAQGVVHSLDAEGLSIPQDWTHFTARISVPDGVTLPGSFSLRPTTNAHVNYLDPVNQLQRGPFALTRPIAIAEQFVKFGALGTYRVVMSFDLTHKTIDADNDGNKDVFTDSGTYTFHVGPISELRVRDGGHSPHVAPNQRAYTIEAVNNGPDAAPVKVTLTGVPQDAEAIFTDGTYQVQEGSCNGGFCDADWNIEPLPVTYPGLPTRTLTLGTSVRDWNIQASIAQARDYTVCIDGDGNDVDASSQTACEATSGNSWHSTHYFDYIDGNNEAVIRSRTGTGEEALKGLRAQFYPPIAIVQWDEMEFVHGYPVSGYEVWSGPAPCQAPGEDDVGVERRTTYHLDYSVRTDEPTCYLVRPVNTRGVPGFWSEPVKTVSGDQAGEPQLSVRGGSVVDEGEAVHFTFIAFPAPAAGENLTVNYTVSQLGDFVAAGDLGPKKVTVDDSGEARISVPTEDDMTDEAHGEVTVRLESGEGYRLASERSAFGTVMDDDRPAVYFADNPAEAEVSEGVRPSTHNVTVSVDPAPHANLTIGYTVASDDAEDGKDYRISGVSSGSGSVTVRRGQTSVDIPVQLVNDGVSEGHEMVVLTLIDGDDYVVGGRPEYTLTITDDDGPGAEFALAEDEINENGGGSRDVTVNLIPAPTEDITVNYHVGGGTAAPGTDYSIDGLTGNSGSEEVTAGTGSFTITVNVIDDSDVEGDETVVLTLLPSPDYTIGTNRKHTLTILDDELLRASFASATSTAGEGVGRKDVTVSLDQNAPRGGLTLRYDVVAVEGSASRNRDYVIHDFGTVAVPEGTNSTFIRVEITDDEENEDDERVVLRLRAGSDYTVGDPDEHELTIEDDDAPMVAFEAAEASVSEKAGRHRAVITLDPAPHEDLTIGYTVDSSGTATEGVHGQHGPGDDFTIRDSGTVTVPRGRNQAFVPITILNDSDAEGDETLTLTLTGGDGYALDTSANIYELTILDDDAPEVSFTAASGEPGEGAGTHVVRVRLDGQTDNPVTVGVSVSFPPNIGSDNTDDHSAIPGSVTIQAGMLETEITVTITDDNLNEADEVVVLTLEPGTGYSLSQDKPTEYTLTIVDNDADENTPVASRDHPHAHGQGSTQFEVYEGHTRIPTWYVTGDFAEDVIFQYVGGTATLDEDFRLFNIDGQIEKVGDTFTVRSLESPHDSDREEGLRWARFTFDPIRDQEREGGETVILRVLNGPGYTVEEPTELTITIID